MDLKELEKKFDQIYKIFKNPIKIKIDKINIARYDKSNIISLKRISRNMRCFIYYNEFLELLDNNKNIDNFINKLEDELQNGLIIVLLNENLFYVMNNKTEINNFIFDRIGSDKNISTIIIIKRCYDNKFIDSKILDNIVNKFNYVKNIQNWSPLYKLEKNNIGNDKWKGHYAIDTTGGTHKGIIEGAIQLANHISDYCSCNMSKIIKYQMIYYMLHCDGIENLLKTKEVKHVEEFRINFDKYCKLMNININNDCINKDKKLVCCVSKLLISYKSFEITNEIHLCHISPVTKFNIKYDKKYGLISSHFYSNIAWGFKKANLLQSDLSIEETYRLNIQITINILEKKIDDSDNIKNVDKNKIRQAICVLQELIL